MFGSNSVCNLFSEKTKTDRFQPYASYVRSGLSLRHFLQHFECLFTISRESLNPESSVAKFLAKDV